MPKARATKIPPRRVLCDTFVVTVDGKDYQPHAGEWVEFQSSASVGDMMVALRLQGLQEGITPEEAGQVGEMLQEVIDHLCQSIVAWTWTDNVGQPYRSPPDAATLRSLSFEELGYLIQHTFGQSEADRKNGSSPST